MPSLDPGARAHKRIVGRLSGARKVDDARNIIVKYLLQTFDLTILNRRVYLYLSNLASKTPLLCKIHLHIRYLIVFCQTLSDHMFTGEYHCFVDGAGLFLLPAPVYAAFAPSEAEATRSVVLLKSLEGCLWMYRTQDWEGKLCALRQQLDDQQSRLLMHYMVAQSMPSSVDTTGRLAIPPPLMGYANITEEVVIVGLYDRLELWSPGHWEEYLIRLEDQHTLVLEKIVSLL